MKKTFLLQEITTKKYYVRTSNKDLTDLINTSTTINFGKNETYSVIQEITEI